MDSVDPEEDRRRRSSSSSATTGDDPTNSSMSSSSSSTSNVERLSRASSKERQKERRRATATAISELPSPLQRLADPGCRIQLPSRPDRATRTALAAISARQMSLLVGHLRSEASLRGRVYALHCWLRLVGYPLDLRLATQMVASMVDELRDAVKVGALESLPTQDRDITGGRNGWARRGVLTSGTGTGTGAGMVRGDVVSPVSRHHGNSGNQYHTETTPTIDGDSSSSPERYCDKVTRGTTSTNTTTSSYTSKSRSKCSSKSNSSIPPTSFAPPGSIVVQLGDVLTWTYEHLGTDAHLTSLGVQVGILSGLIPVADEALRLAEQHHVPNDSHLLCARIQLAGARGDRAVVESIIRSYTGGEGEKEVNARSLMHDEVRWSGSTLPESLPSIPDVATTRTPTDLMGDEIGHRSSSRTTTATTTSPPTSTTSTSIPAPASCTPLPTTTSTFSTPVPLSNHVLTALASASRTVGLPPSTRWSLCQVARRHRLKLNAHSAAALAADLPADRASEIFRWMLDAGHLPDVVACTAVIGALGRDGDVGRASQFLTWMVDHGLAPNAVTLSVHAQNVARGSTVAATLSALEAMERRFEVEPNHQTFAMCVLACPTARGAAELYAYYEDRLLNRRVGRHGRPEVVLGTALKRQLQSGAGPQVLRDYLRRARGLGIRVTSFHLNMVVVAVGREEGYVAACREVASMEGEGKSDVVTLETLLGVAATEGRTVEAEQLLAEVTKRYGTPTDKAMSSLLRAYVTAGQARLGVMRCRPRFVRFGAQLGVYNALLTACEEAELYDVAVELYWQIKQGLLGVYPDGNTHLIMDSVCAKGLSRVQEQQALVSGLVAAGAAAGAMLMRVGLL